MHKIAPIPLIILAISGAAWGWNPNQDCPAIPDDSHDAQIAAGTLFNQGNEQYSDGRPLESLRSFLCAHNVIQHENTLFNIAQISKLNETREAALVVLKEYVKNTKGANKVNPIQDIIDELEQLLISDGAMPANQSDADSGPEPLEATTALSDERMEEPESAKPLKITGLTLMGAGGAGLIVGAVLQGLAGSAQTSAEETHSFYDFKAERDKMKHLQTGAMVGFVAGGVLAGTGLALFLIGNKGSGEHSGAQVTFAPTPTGLLIRGRF